MQLKDIAQIQIGYQHRKRGDLPSTSKDPGTHRIIQIKDINDKRQLNSAQLSSITPKGNPVRYIVNEGDVLFLARGHRAYAVPICAPLNNTIAAYYFYILQLSNNSILPEYLAWHINNPKAQAFLESHQRGSHIKMIPKSSFEKLEIVVPPIAIQKTIVELDGLREREELLMQKIFDTRKHFMNSVMIEASKCKPSTY